MSNYRSYEREVWWTIPRVFILGIVAIAMLYIIGFLATGGDLAIYRFWAPKQADAERQVFEHSQSYVEGKVQHIGQLCHDASKAEGVQRTALMGEIRNEAATINALPTDEQACVVEARGF